MQNKRQPLDNYTMAYLNRGSLPGISEELPGIFPWYFKRVTDWQCFRFFPKPRLIMVC